MAAASTSASQQVSPLTAVSLFGTQASAQTVCAAGTSAAATAGAAAAAAQGGPGCVLPATDVPPPVGQGAPPPPTGDFGINWLLAGLGALAFLGGLFTLFNDDDDDNVPFSPG